MYEGILVLIRPRVAFYLNVERYWANFTACTYCPQVPARVMNNTPCGCGLRCFDTVNREQRKKLFDGYWSSCDFNVQSAYLCGCVKTVAVKRRYTKKASSRRLHSRVYYVSKGGLSVRVCKKAFLRIHSISNGRLDRALRAQITNDGSPHNDQRGCHPPANKTSDADTDLIKEHIQSSHNMIHIILGLTIHIGNIFLRNSPSQRCMCCIRSGVLVKRNTTK